MKWRVLVVEDKADIASQIKQAIPGFVEAPDSASAVTVGSFSEAEQRMHDERFDMLILDLKDDSEAGTDEHDVSAGMQIFEALKAVRFAPVVFYTAHAHKVKALETSYVRVVEKSEGLEKLKLEVNAVLNTKLPTLSRNIEETQRAYMWDFVAEHWKSFKSDEDRGALAYMMARRLAAKLQSSARDYAANLYAGAAPANLKRIHPMEMYIHPALSEQWKTGDIVCRTEADAAKTVWLVLTPSCDFEQGHADTVLLARCKPLAEEDEYAKWIAKTEKAEGELKSLIGDRRHKSQSERFKFLHGTFFLEDAVVDFQGLRVVSLDELNQMEKVASLDSPYAEAVLAKFATYVGRLGTPDIDKALVIQRLESLLPQ